MTASDAPEPRRSRRLGVMVVGTSIAVAAALLFLLVGGRGGPDPTGDVQVVEGLEPEEPGGPPASESLADIVRGSVTRAGSRFVFAATMVEPIPRELERSSLEIRFDLSEDGRETWIVVATVNVAVVASVVSHMTSYGTSTIDGTMPGSVEVSGDALTIEVDAAQIEGFPQAFDWSLSSTLTAFRDTPGSTRFEDRYPDDGFLAGP